MSHRSMTIQRLLADVKLDAEEAFAFPDAAFEAMTFREAAAFALDALEHASFGRLLTPDECLASASIHRSAREWLAGRITDGELKAAARAASDGYGGYGGVARQLTAVDFIAAFDWPELVHHAADVGADRVRELAKQKVFEEGTREAAWTILGGLSPTACAADRIYADVMRAAAASTSADWWKTIHTAAFLAEVAWQRRHAVVLLSRQPPGSPGRVSR